MLKIIWNMDGIKSENLCEVLDKASQSPNTREVVKKIDETLSNFQAEMIIRYINQQPISYDAKVNLLESIKQKLKAS